VAIWFGESSSPLAFTAQDFLVLLTSKYLLKIKPRYCISWSVNCTTRLSCMPRTLQCNVQLPITSNATIDLMDTCFTTNSLIKAHGLTLSGTQLLRYLERSHLRRGLHHPRFKLLSAGALDMQRTRFTFKLSASNLAERVRDVSR
jgi:hypothetical protein